MNFTSHDSRWKSFVSEKFESDFSPNSKVLDLIFSFFHYSTDTSGKAYHRTGA